MRRLRDAPGKMLKSLSKKDLLIGGGPHSKPTGFFNARMSRLDDGAGEVGRWKGLWKLLLSEVVSPG